MDYFNHPNVSNSDLKRWDSIVNPSSRVEIPKEKLDKIFAFGHVVEDCIFQPHQADRTNPDIERAERMAEIFRKDEICKDILWVPDLRRQHEWYMSTEYGIPGKCKADADSKRLSIIFELKGMAVNSDKQFEEGLRFLNYDMGGAWYLDVSRYRRFLLVAVSKTVDKVFKRLIDRRHPLYESGKIKVDRTVRQYIDMFGDEYANGNSQWKF